ncbi:MAG: hypothetical protein FWH00_03590, partial [Oscillospiraceae bacterium]|nr:hypothetical protein [Oscillospiraceae bacterium]
GDVLYYEIYGDGTFGVFTRRFDSGTPTGYRDVDYLNNDPGVLIIESGYGVAWPGLQRPPGNLRAYARANRTDRLNAQGVDPLDTGWTMIFSNNTGVPLWESDQQFFYVPGVDMRMIKLLTRSTDLAYTTGDALSRARPHEPFVIWINSAGGGGQTPDANPAGVMYINPLFAKEVYPVLYSGEGRIDSPVVAPAAHYIRTPWQMSNISRVTDFSGGSREFILENNFLLSRPTTVVPVRNWAFNAAAGSFTTRNVTFNATTSAALNYTNGIGAALSVTASTANIVTGTFGGIFNGNSRTIAGLSLTGAANSKGIFNTIGAGGIVRNLTMADCTLQGGTQNGGFASVNNGRIENVAFVSASSQAPVGGASAGGIVWSNVGVIRNALYLAHAPGNNPIAASGSPTSSETYAYYLSGTRSRLNPSTPTGEFGGPFNPNRGSIAIGTGLTTQELNKLILSVPPGNPWQFPPSGVTTGDLMASALYPYPVLGSPPASWPVAAIAATGLAYFDQNDSAAWAALASGADAAAAISKGHGYWAVVPQEGYYTVSTAPGVNPSRVTVPAYPHGGIWYVPLPAFFDTASRSNPTVAVLVNDVHLSGVNTLFAPGFGIRTPAQMRNIGLMNSTSGITFNQERNLDFTGINLDDDGAVVTGTFNGIFNGNAHTISNVHINAPDTTPGPGIGLFAHNAGTINGVTLYSSSFAGQGSHHVLQSAVAGINDGVIYNP